MVNLGTLRVGFVLAYKYQNIVYSNDSFRFHFLIFHSSSATELISRRGVFSRRHYGSTDQVSTSHEPTTHAHFATEFAVAFIVSYRTGYYMLIC